MTPVIDRRSVLRRILGIAAAGGVVAAMAAAPAGPPLPAAMLDDGEKAALILDDEFDGAGLDRSKWCTRYQHAGGPPLQVRDPECLKFGAYGTLDFLQDEQQRYVDINRDGVALHQQRDGVLHLMATQSRADAYVQFEAAMIRSKQEFRPSRDKALAFVARVRLPNVLGTWPGFWVAPGIDAAQKTAWPPEIDFMEGALNASSDKDDMMHLGSQQQNWGREGVSKSAQTKLTLVGDGYDAATRRYTHPTSLRETWVRFTTVWRHDSVCHFVDDKKVACEAYEWIDNARRLAPPGPVMLNLAIGGHWAGADGIETAKFPVDFSVDYVRVYELTRPLE